MVAVPVGAVAVMLLETGLKRGITAASAGALGVATVDALYALAASHLGTFVQGWLEPRQMEVMLVGGIALLWLGYKGIRRGLSSEQLEPEVDTSGPVFLFFKFFSITALNPLTITFFLGFIVATGAASVESLGGSLLFTLGVLISSGGWQLALASIGAFGGSKLEHVVKNRISIIGNGLVLLIGGGLVTDSLIKLITASA